MDPNRYFCFPGSGKPKKLGFIPDAARENTLWLDGGVEPGCIFCETGWFKSHCVQPGLLCHDSDELLMFIGTDPSDPHSLGATVELHIENDVIVLDQTSAVFIPAGAAHGDIRVGAFERPFLYCMIHLTASEYSSRPAEATVPAGTFCANTVNRYAPVDGVMPEAPEGFLIPILWLDSRSVQGAPYMESVWFCTSNDTGPEEHTHDFDELVGFLGTDPEKPDDLGGVVTFDVDDRRVRTEKSCVVYVPRGVKHSPILVPGMYRNFIHFTLGNGGAYVRKKN